MANLNAEERDLVEGAQAELARVKQGLRRISDAMRKLAKINRDAGRAKASNAAMRLEGVATSVLGDLIQGHADASDSLADSYDDGGVIIFGGGGGRG